MYIRSDISFWPQNIWNLRGSVEAQAIWVSMTRTRSLVLVNLYVPPVQRWREKAAPRDGRCAEVRAPWTRCALGWISQRTPPRMGPSSGGGGEGRDPEHFDGIQVPATIEQWKPHEI